MLLLLFAVLMVLIAGIVFVQQRRWTDATDLAGFARSQSALESIVHRTRNEPD